MERIPKRKKGNQKQEFIQFIKHQLNLELENSDYFLNRKRNILYTCFPQRSEGLNEFKRLLNKIGANYNEHLEGYHWIRLTKELMQKIVASNDKVYEYKMTK